MTEFTDMSELCNGLGPVPDEIHDPIWAMMSDWERNTETPEAKKANRIEIEKSLDNLLRATGYYISDMLNPKRNQNPAQQAQRAAASLRRLYDAQSVFCDRAGMAQGCLAPKAKGMSRTLLKLA